MDQITLEDIGTQWLWYDNKLINCLVFDYPICMFIYIVCKQGLMLLYTGFSYVSHIVDMNI